MAMAASSKVFANIESKYEMASVVNIYNFVSVNLSWFEDDDYMIWKAQMLSLIESWELLHVINAEHPSSVDESVIENAEMISKFEKLVKHWILSTLSQRTLSVVENLGTAREVWMELESIFDEPTTDTEEDDPQKQDDEFMQALRVRVSEFVSGKISGRRNYYIWRAEMLYLIECQKLLHIIDAEYPFPKDKGVHMISMYENLVKGWIFTTMDRQVLKDFMGYSSVQSIWRELESRFNPPITNREGDPVDASALEDLKYIHVSTVNVSSFVSVKLLDPSNYPIWRNQMMCLINSQDLNHIIKAEAPVLEHIHCHLTKKYCNLVKGWILGTMSDQLLKTFSECDSAQFVWSKLETKFSSSENDTKEETNSDTQDLLSEGFTFRKELLTNIPELEISKDIKQKEDLYKAAVEGSWWKAKSILKFDKSAATRAITQSGDTILHLAVERGHNNFVEKLLKFLKGGEDIKTRNKKGRTALHIAAMANNLHAAQLLVQKEKELLEIRDYSYYSPSNIANAYRKLNISTYLMKCMIPDTEFNFNESYITDTIQAAIYTKQYDLARILLEKKPISADYMQHILMAITVTFPTDLGLMESYIYPSFKNVSWKTFLGESLLFHCISVTDILPVMKIGNNTCRIWFENFFMIILVPIATLYPIYQVICLLFQAFRLTFSMLYFLLWKILAATVRPIKNIEKKKLEYDEAKVLLAKVLGKSERGYKKAILEAVRQDTYEVVDEILFKSPRRINYELDEDGHNVMQLAIINRSEKVYNLIHHIIERVELYRAMKDSLGNNLVHLAGKLAPPFVLDRTTGAALQLQRELIWREEVEKLMLPLELIGKNKYSETPAELFTNEHQDLMKQGEAWMKTTAESCSITAALIITIVFAAAITVPGGNDQQSGTPVFKKEIAFGVFALFNAFSLFTAATSLLLFLSILTARFSERDFLVSLPRRLILGLFTLFISTTAMIVAFGAILFIVFCDQKPWMLAPICVLACLPISVIVTIKLPLLVDLIRTTYFPIFGERSYLESCKINMKNTTFTGGDLRF